jgi:hypothetical protein
MKGDVFFATNEKRRAEIEGADVQVRGGCGAYRGCGTAAIGEQVTYRQGSAQYTVRSYEGYAISPAGPEGPTRCTALSNAIDAAWPSS